jgi:hypothetical protein
MSSEYASLYFANTYAANAAPATRLGLIQSASCAYQQATRAVFEAGSSSIFWQTGQSLGTIQVGRMVGQNGILDGVNPGNQSNSLGKGFLGGIEFKLGRLGLQGVNVSQSVLVLGGAILSSVGWSFTTGGLDVSEAVTIQAAIMSQALTL